MKRQGKCAGKRRYTHRNIAWKQAKFLYKRYGVKNAVYECRTCLDFHLTTKYYNKKRVRSWDKEIVSDQYSQFCVLERKLCGKPKKKQQPTKPKPPTTLPLAEQRRLLKELAERRVWPWWKKCLNYLLRK